MITHKMVLLVVAPAVSALVVATAGAQAHSGSARDSAVAAAEPPTVLPTIIGVHRKSAKRPSTASSPIPYPTTITAAGPVYSTATGELDPVSEPAPVVEPVLIEVPGGVPFYGDDGRYGLARLRNGWNDGRFDSRHRQNGWRERQGWTRAGYERVGPGSAPRHAPIPIGVPAPRRAH